MAPGVLVAGDGASQARGGEGNWDTPVSSGRVAQAALWASWSILKCWRLGRRRVKHQARRKVPDGLKVRPGGGERGLIEEGCLRYIASVKARVLNADAAMHAGPTQHDCCQTGSCSAPVSP